MRNLVLLASALLFLAGFASAAIQDVSDSFDAVSYHQIAADSKDAPAGKTGVTSTLAAETNNQAYTSDQTVLVIASEVPQIDAATSDGCKIVKSVFSNYKRKLVGMECPAEIAGALGLQQDLELRVIDLDANNLIGANKVHGTGNIGTGTKVALIDSGIDYNHRELMNSYLGGWDFIQNDNDPMDENGHGTIVAGIITADGSLLHENPVQAPYKYSAVRGVAPGAGIYMYRILNANGVGSTSDFIAAVYRAIDGADGIYGTLDDPHPDVISASVGWLAYVSTYCDHWIPSLTEAIDYADGKNVPVVIAAGNEGDMGISLPGCVSSAITVGAVDKVTDLVASFSSQGNAIDIVAPGTQMYSTKLGGGYTWGTGTSVAAPVVAGTIALIKKAHPEYTSLQIKNALRNAAVDKAGVNPGQVNHNSDAIPPGPDRRFSKAYGWGRVDAYRSVNPNFNYHTECRANACVLVQGAGSDACGSDLECFCTDTDGGKNYNVFGQASGMQNNEWGVRSDSCSSQSTLVEYYCNGREINSEEKECENGCENGACHSTNQQLPDLIVAPMQSAPRWVMNFQTQLEITTKNIGLLASNQSATHYYLDQGYLGAIPVPPLQAAASFSSTASLACTQLGNHRVSALADALQQVEESNEENNGKYLDFECVPPSPDLIVSAIIVPAQVPINRPTPASIVVSNIGVATANQSITRYYVQGMGWGEVTVQLVPPGLSQTSIVTIMCTELGYTQFTATADIYDEVYELDEYNNENSVSFECVSNLNVNEDGTKNEDAYSIGAVGGGANEKKPCPILPTLIDCGKDTSNYAVWYDKYGCSYQCKKYYEKTSTGIAPGTASEKAPATGKTVDDTTSTGSTPSEKEKDDGDNSDDAADSISNSMVADGDLYAKVMNTLGVYVGQFRKFSQSSGIGF